MRLKERAHESAGRSLVATGDVTSGPCPANARRSLQERSTVPAVNGPLPHPYSNMQLGSASRPSGPARANVAGTIDPVAAAGSSIRCERVTGVARLPPRCAAANFGRFPTGVPSALAVSFREMGPGPIQRQRCRPGSLRLELVSFHGRAGALAAAFRRDALGPAAVSQGMPSRTDRLQAPWQAHRKRLHRDVQWITARRTP